MIKYTLLFLFAAVGGLLAQSPTKTLPRPAPIATPPPIDAQWEKLKSFGRPVAAKGGKKATRSEEAARLVEEADQLRAFYTANSNHPAAKEAKVKEVVALALARLQGEARHDARRETALAQIRNDKSVSLARRFEAVAWSGRAASSLSGSAGRAAKFAAEEKLTRELIAEFPEHPVGYESLVGLARDAAPERGRIIARDVLGMATAPAKVKAEAQRVLDRHALVGKNLHTLLQQAGAAALALTGQESKVTLVYAWSQSMPHTRLMAKRFASHANQAQFVGLCLDSNLNEATQAARSNQLPGQQCYDARGAGSPLAHALNIGRDAVIYVVDREGVIRDVQGHIDLKEKIAQLAK